MMNFTDLFLMATYCAAVAVIVAIVLDIFYSEKKKIQFSLRRVSMWYLTIFVLSFIPSIVLAMPNL